MEKYNFKDTIMDERLLSEYKDEIKLDIAKSLGIDIEDDALTTNKVIKKETSKKNKYENKR